MLAPRFGAMAHYLCIRNKKTKAMRNTDYSTDVLSNVISPDTNFQALKDLMKDLGLEMEDAVAL